MLSSELAEEVGTTLDDVRKWELTSARWLTVAGRVTDIDAAIRSGDESAVVEAAIALEVLSPIRSTRIGTVPTIPPPQHVTELVNETIDSLRGAAEDRRGAARPPELDDDRIPG